MFYANATVYGSLDTATGPLSSTVCFAAIDDLQSVTYLFAVNKSVLFVKQQSKFKFRISIQAPDVK
jgi:hypothetical protein